MDSLSQPDVYNEPQPFPLNPEISEEENRIVEDWWSTYDDLEDPDTMLFYFSKETMDKAIMAITSGSFHMPDPTASLSLLNAIYYFADYLKKCNMLDGMNPEIGHKTTAKFYEDLLPGLSAYSSLTCCFKVFPFWGRIEKN